MGVGVSVEEDFMNIDIKQRWLLFGLIRDWLGTLADGHQRMNQIHELFSILKEYEFADWWLIKVVPMYILLNSLN